MDELFDVVLVDCGPYKLSVAKIVYETLGKEGGSAVASLLSAKTMVDRPSSVVETRLTKDEAEELKSKLEAKGAKVLLRPVGR